MLATRFVSATRPVLPAVRKVSSPPLVCRAHAAEDVHCKTVALPVAAMVAGALLAGSFAPDEALAAVSSGRAGSSSGFSSRKAARSSTTVQSTSVSSTTVVMAPPVAVAPPMYSPFGFGGFGFGGFHFMPVVTVPLFGGLFQFLVLAMIVSAVFGVVSSMASATTVEKKEKREDEWGSM